MLVFVSLFELNKINKKICCCCVQKDVCLSCCFGGVWFSLNARAYIFFLLNWAAKV